MSDVITKRLLSDRIIALETGILEAMKQLENGDDDEAYQILDIIIAMDDLGVRKSK